MGNASFFYIISNKKGSRCTFAGIALTLLLNGCTFHSNFKVRMDPELESQLKINKKSKLASIQIQTELLVIEKATKLYNNYLENLQEKLKGLKQNNIPFEGFLIILSEDFLQTLKLLTKSHQVSIKDSKH